MGSRIASYVGIGLALWVGGQAWPRQATAQPFHAVQVETGRRPAGDGTETDYGLYVPQRGPRLPGPPWPTLVVTHGFARDFSRMTLVATYLAQQGFVVLTPTMPDLLSGDDASRQAAVDQVRASVEWLIRRGATARDSLHRLIDGSRLGVVGHSAGGAVSLEVVWELQFTATPVAALVLLDAVPWPRTLERAASLVPLDVMSLRAPGSACNASGSGERIVSALPFPSYDVIVTDATHCDPEAPTDIGCTWVCGGTSVAARERFQDLTLAFLQDSLAWPGSQRLDRFARRLLHQAGNPAASGALQIVRIP